MPVIIYSADVFKTDDDLLIDRWIKRTAAKDLEQLERIDKKYNISQWRLKAELIRRKAYSNFILGNWDKLKTTEKAFKDISQMPEALRKAGLGELASYAKLKLQLPVFNETDFSKNYMRIFKQGIDELTQQEKIDFIGRAINLIGKSQASYDDEVKKFSSASTISDTSLFSLFQGYVYKTFYPGIKNEFKDFIQNSISASFTKADSLRGTLTPERTWWDVQRYDITVRPEYKEKTIFGINEIRYMVVTEGHPRIMQIDLQVPMIIDSIFLNSEIRDFKNEGNAWYVSVPEQDLSSENSLLIYFHGKPVESQFPPWDGGWVWSKDSLGNPWMSVACQGLGASVWYPCKDHQSDEPDNGASLTMIVPEDLVGVANGRLTSQKNNNDGTVSFRWDVINPINNYNIIPNIGKYVNFFEAYSGEKGQLDLSYWVIDYNIEKAKKHAAPEVHRMLKTFEHWFGPYPFYEDSYKLVEAPYPGMEHQSAIAYGNKYKNGFFGIDPSGTGWGNYWDYMIVHESGHEWFGNSITTVDIADMWVHEGFTTYSETLFSEDWYGKEAGNEFTKGIRNNISNSFPVIGFYGVNDEGKSSDKYAKGSNMLHSIRHSMNDDEKFRNILRDMNKTFYHQEVTTAQIENFINQNSE
ncbi:MAG: M1 family metallopeptidase, partial [Bacteroidota bacterium]|nr:M1 family metallopeptidase [Bacteroidota bacterium]